jgi:hypothetical protein
MPRPRNKPAAKKSYAALEAEHKAMRRELQSLRCIMDGYAYAESNHQETGNCECWICEQVISIENTLDAVEGRGE